ncbi:hypothetical protein EGW08_010856, partial [Elysia chlorotica]
GKMGRPVLNTMDNLTVYFGLSLIQILDVDESNQVLKSSMWYHYQWTDLLLQWDPTQHNNITTVRVPSNNIWLPDILLYNLEIDRERDRETERQRQAQAWHRQRLERDVVRYILKKVQIKGGDSKYEFDGFITISFVNEWDIIENQAVRNVKYYTCCPDPYPDLTFNLRLQRKTAFYTFILILPCTLLSLLTLVIFWVPPESPAKLQLGMSVFVAFFFLLLVLADFTPRAAASIPLIGAYFCLSMVMITLSTVLACVVANMYFRGVRVNRAPTWMRAVNLKLAKVRLLENGLTSRSVQPTDQYDTLEKDLGYDSVPERDASALLLEEVKMIKEMLLREQEKRQSEEERNKYLREWRIIACITDRVFFILYVAINVITIVVLF